jgi:predicted RNase H-like HicB family nuclease
MITGESHRQDKHSTKAGRVTVAGKASEQLAQGTASSRPGSRSDDMRYAVVIEKAGENYSAYLRDLPGCIATGATVAETEVEIGDAIRFHIKGLREDGLPVPEAVSLAEYVEA